MAEDFGIDEGKAAQMLRPEIERGPPPGLEGTGIPHRVVVKDGRFGPWFVTPRQFLPGGETFFVAVTEFGGWSAVDWRTGTVEGRVIEVHWLLVQEMLTARLGQGPVPQGASADDGAQPVQRQPPRIDYRDADEPLAVEMAAMIADGRARNVTDAARAVVAGGGVAGHGNDASKVRRLTRYFTRRR